MKPMKPNFNEQGYALYVVIAFCMILFMLLSQLLFFYVREVDMVYLQEGDLRAQTLLHSGLTLWIDQLEEDASPQPLTILELEEGQVFFDIQAEETYWLLEIKAEVVKSEMKQRAKVKIDRATLQIIEWQDL